MAETSSGGFLANDCLVHFTVSALPFGGVGEWQTVVPAATSSNGFHGFRVPDLLTHLFR